MADVVKRLGVKNYRGIKSLVSIDLDKNLTVVLGPDRTGKSSFLDAFQFLGDWTCKGSSHAVREDLRSLRPVAEKKEAGRCIPWDTGRTTGWEVNVELGSGQGASWWSEVQLDEDLPCVIYERLVVQEAGDDAWQLVLSRSKKHGTRIYRGILEDPQDAYVPSNGLAMTFLDHLEGPTAAMRRALKSFRLFKPSPLHMRSRSKSIPANCGPALRGEDLEGRLLGLIRAGKGDELVRLLKPFIDWTGVDGSQYGESTHVVFLSKSAQRPCQINQASDGELVLAYLASLVAWPPQGRYTLLLDDIDAYVSAEAYPLLESLVRALAEHHQVVLATKSEALADLLGRDGNTWVLGRQAWDGVVSTQRPPGSNQ